MENNWKWIHEEINSLYEIYKDESLPIGLRSILKKELLEIKHDIESMIIDLS